MNSGHILNSWKEISSYLGRGIRTVQRWEILFGMPVHRPAGKERSAVVAFAEELDAWLQSARTQVAVGAEAAPIVIPVSSMKHIEQMRIQADRLLRQTDELMQRHNQLNEHMRRSMALKNQLATITVKTRREEEKPLIPLKPAV